MGVEQTDARLRGAGDDFVVGLETGFRICLGDAVSAQLRGSSFRDRSGRGAMNYEAALCAERKRADGERKAKLVQGENPKALRWRRVFELLEHAHCHAHGVIPLVHINGCAGDSAGERARKECCGHSYFFSS